MGQGHPAPIKAPGVSRGIAHRRTRDPVACAQGFYGTGAPRPNKSPRRKPGDRTPPDQRSRRLRSGLLWDRGTPPQ
jgi:hypothetical protein